MNLGGEDVSLMNDRAQEFLTKARQRPEIGMIYTTLNTTTPMYKFNVDRDKAQSLNVPVSSVFSALLPRRLRNQRPEQLRPYMESCYAG